MIMGKYPYLFLFTLAFRCLMAQPDSLAVLELNFALDSYNLSAEQRMRVDSLLEEMPLTIVKRMEIYGHTDSLAGLEYNRELSKNRVLSILQYLVKRGADPTMVSTDYFGEEKPKYDNGPDQRFRNRRVEVHFFIDPALIPPPEQKLSDLPFRKGDKVRIPNLNFVGNQAVPVWQSFSALVELLEVMKKNPDLRIELQGHVCCGDDYELSLHRAAMVHHFLRSNNIDPQRLSYEGYSNSRPLFPEKSDREKALNRRVEVLVLENSDRQQKVNLDEVNFDVEARLLNIAFFPGQGRLMPSGDFMLELIGEMMKSSEGLFYEFILVDNIQNPTLSRQRVRAMERKFQRMRIKSNTFNVAMEDRPPAMPQSENDNYITVKIRKQ